MMRADRGLHHGRIQPTACHQTGCGRIPIHANLRATMAEALASCRRAGSRRSSIGVRKRSDDGESRAGRIFQPGNADAHRNRTPVNPAGFKPRGRCFGYAGGGEVHEAQRPVEVADMLEEPGPVEQFEQTAMLVRGDARGDEVFGRARSYPAESR